MSVLEVCVCVYAFKVKFIEVYNLCMIKLMEFKCTVSFLTNIQGHVTVTAIKAQNTSLPSRMSLCSFAASLFLVSSDPWQLLIRFLSLLFCLFQNAIEIKSHIGNHSVWLPPLDIMLLNSSMLWHMLVGQSFLLLSLIPLNRYTAISSFTSWWTFELFTVWGYFE